MEFHIYQQWRLGQCPKSDHSSGSPALWFLVCEELWLRSLPRAGVWVLIWECGHLRLPWTLNPTKGLQKKKKKILPLKIHWWGWMKLPWVSSTPECMFTASGSRGLRNLCRERAALCVTVNTVLRHTQVAGLAGCCVEWSRQWMRWGWPVLPGSPLLSPLLRTTLEWTPTKILLEGCPHTGTYFYTLGFYELRMFMSLVTVRDNLFGIEVPSLRQGMA